MASLYCENINLQPASIHKLEKNTYSIRTKDKKAGRQSHGVLAYNEEAVPEASHVSTDNIVKRDGNRMAGA